MKFHSEKMKWINFNTIVANRSHSKKMKNIDIEDFEFKSSNKMNTNIFDSIIISSRLITSNCTIIFDFTTTISARTTIFDLTTSSSVRTSVSENAISSHLKFVQWWRELDDEVFLNHCREIDSNDLKKKYAMIVVMNWYSTAKFVWTKKICVDIMHQQMKMLDQNVEKMKKR